MRTSTCSPPDIDCASANRATQSKPSSSMCGEVRAAIVGVVRMWRAASFSGFIGSPFAGRYVAFRGDRSRDALRYVASMAAGRRTETAILDAARELLAEGGVGGLTVEGVA